MTEQQLNLLTHILKFYSDKVTKKGKPQGSEFTIFAAFVLVDCSLDNNYGNSVATNIVQENQFIVCSIGTGTKCIGHDLIEKDINSGFLLHDCHAEVMARRSFIKFLYSLMENDRCSLFFDWIEEEKKWKLKNNFKLHMILTELPCGDCSIVSSNNSQSSLLEQIDNQPNNSDITFNNNSNNNNSNDNNDNNNNEIHVEENGTKRKIDTTLNPTMKKQKVILEGRTGSKIIHNDSSCCTHEKFGDDQSINLVRLKPGGGSRNQSMSCSDKITKWNVVGIQGSLLSNFFEPIFVEHYLILLSEKSKLDLKLARERLQQSIVLRPDQQLSSNNRLPSFHLFKEGPNIPLFTDRASESKIKGSGYSIGSFLKVVVDDNYQNNSSNTLSSSCFSYGEEIVIGMKGHKQGTTKKDENSPKSASQLSKYMLFKSFIDCASKNHKEVVSKTMLDSCKKEYTMQTYQLVKNRESLYRSKLNSFKSKSPFDKWIVKKM